MKRLILFVVAMFFIVACQSCTSSMQQIMAQGGIVKVLKNNPKYIEPMINGLTVISDYLKCGVCGVADLKDIIAKSLPKEYAADVADIIMASVDDPALTSYIDGIINKNLKPETVAKVKVFVDGLIVKLKAIQVVQ